MVGLMGDTLAYIRTSVMGAPSAGEAAASSPEDGSGTSGAPKLGLSGKKICCACPDTRRARDACTVTANGDPEVACRAVIEAHNACLRADGFQL